MTLSRNCFKYLISIILSVFIFIFLTGPIDAKGSTKSSKKTIESIEASLDSGDTEKDLSTEKVKSKKPDKSIDSGSSLMSMSSSGGGAGGSSFSIPSMDTYQFTGAATAKIPIIVPPSRGGITPNLALTYNSYKKNGWLGVGWDLDMGAIQRSTKRGVDYNADDYIAFVNGSSSELVPRTAEWGQNYYGAKIEGGFSKYYKNPAGGWIVTAKDGKTYYYGTSAESRQDNSYGVFKWCLDKVEDTNGNYMTVSYTKNYGQIYLDRIDYTGNGSLEPSSYVKFYLESRTDDPPLYTIHTEVITAKRLKTIDIVANDSRVRTYTLKYDESVNTFRSRLISIQQFGCDSELDSYGEVLEGPALPVTGFEWREAINSFESDTKWGTMTTGFHPTNGGPMMVDATGDGMSDYLYVTATGGVRILKNFGPLPDLLSSVINPFGSTFAFSYEPSSSYDNTLMPFIVHPVSKIKVNDGNGVVSETDYSYSGWLFDFATREFRGFKTATQTNHDGTTLKTKFYQGDPNDPEDSYFFKGRQDWIEFSEPNEGPLISKTDFTWETYPASPSVDSWAFVKLSQKRTEFYDDVTVFTQEVHTYNNTNGNLLTTVATGTDAEAITKTNQYQNFGSWLWRLTQETVEGSTSGKVRESFYGYETNTGNLQSKEFWLNTGANPRISYTYDTYGNMLTQTDARGNTTTTEYETTTYTYPKKTIYPQTGGVTHIVENEAYDYRYGKVTISKDENGNRTYYNYDEFGRPIQVDFPDGGQATTQYFDDVFPRYVISKVKENASGDTIDKYEYFDGLGRTIQTITFGENNQSIVSKMLYDEMGRNYKVEGPFFSTGVGYPKSPPTEYPWVETTFDYRGRPVEVRSPDSQYGTILSVIDYSGFSTTSTDPDGSQKSEKKDYLGRLIQVTEYTDTEQYTTTYAYNAAGDMLNVTDHLGNITTINYDTLGRKINMTDPDMGYWAYTYDANGNLLTQTDAKGQVITFAYDQLNRVTSKTYSTSDPTVTYVYDNLSISNGKGKLYSVSNTNVTTTTNAYDAMGRETSVSKTIIGDPTVYTTQYSYDLSGKPISTTYPDSYQVNNYYYPGTGLLSSVVGITNFTEYAQLSGYQPTGKIGQVDHGNNTSTIYTYDPKSTRLTAIVSKDSNQVDIQNRAYSYSSAGDIEQIVDNKNSITYTYEYDYLHRLMSETNTGSYDPVTYTYNAIGNMMSKTVGTDTYNYTYANSSRKHAVSSINYNGNNYNYTYDDNGNMTGGPDFSNPGQVNTRSITFNADNMPTIIVHSAGGTTNLTYDGGGGRAKKSVQGGSTTYYVGEHYEVINGTATKYIFAGNLRIAMVSSTGKTYFHKDHLGSSTVMTDATGLTVEAAVYMPYGHMRAHTGTTQTHYKFTDQELDPESGLYNYGARLYDPIIGRFISPDTIVQDPSDPQTLNRYSYCRNNPLIYIDPMGYGFFSSIGDFFEDVVKGIGNTLEGIAHGDIKTIATVAISAAAFWVAGQIISAVNSIPLDSWMSTEMAIQTGLRYSVGAQAAIHVGSGAYAGAWTSAINGGDIGRDMLTSGISAGISKYAGSQLFGEGKLFSDSFVSELAGRSFVGGVTGGITAEIYGGSFDYGFRLGAGTAALGYLFNDITHRGKPQMHGPVFDPGINAYPTLKGYAPSNGDHLLLKAAYDLGVIAGQKTAEQAIRNLPKYGKYIRPLVSVILDTMTANEAHAPECKTCY